MSAEPAQTTAAADVDLALTGRAKLAQDKARVLQEALPWMTRWTGRTVVVKYGGNALTPTDDGPGEDPSFARDVALLHSVGVRCEHADLALRQRHHDRRRERCQVRTARRRRRRPHRLR